MIEAFQNVIFWLQLNGPHPSIIIAASVLAFMAVLYWDNTEWKDEDRWR